MISSEKQGVLRSGSREARTFALLAGAFFAILFGSYLGQNAGLSILLARHGAAALPRAYVANAIVLAAASFLTIRQVRRLPLRPVMIGVFAVGAVAVQVVKWAHGAEAWWAAGALYVTAFALTDLVIVLFWSVANRVYDTRDAKRLFPLLSAAGTLGAACSGFFARGLVARIGTERLLDIWAVILVGCAVWSHFAAGGPGEVGTEDGGAARRSCARAGGARPAPGRQGLLWAIGTGLVFVVTVTLFGRFLYGKALDAAYPDAEALASVNGLLIGLSGVLTLLVQLFVASRLMSRLGVGVVGAVYPILMLGAFAGLYARFGMAAAVVCFFGITTLRRGIQGVVENVLYTPLPPELAARSLVFMAMVAIPVGLALAGGGLELLRDARPETVAAIGLAAAATCGLAAVWRAYGYRSALRTRLLRGGSDVRVRFGALLYGSSATVESILSEGLDAADPELLERLRTLIRAQQVEEGGAARPPARWDESGPLGRVVDARLAESYRLHAALEALPALEAADPDALRKLEDLWRSAIRQRIGEDIAVVLAALRAGTHLADFDRISLRVSDADRRVRAAAVEILDTLCPEGVRSLLLPLLEEKRLPEGAWAARRRYGKAAELAVGPEEGGVVATLLEIPDGWVRATTAYASAHLDRPNDRPNDRPDDRPSDRPEDRPDLPRLRELASSPDRFVSFAAEYAISRSQG